MVISWQKRIPHHWLLYCRHKGTIKKRFDLSLVVTPNKLFILLPRGRFWTPCDIISLLSTNGVQMYELLIFKHVHLELSIRRSCYNINSKGIKSFCTDVRTRTLTAKFIGSTWGPLGSCWPQMGPILTQWTLLSGTFSYSCLKNVSQVYIIDESKYHFSLYAVFKWLRPCSIIH